MRARARAETDGRRRDGRYGPAVFCLILVLLISARWNAAAGEPDFPVFTLPREGRPDWLRREGIVMAGSWEPLLFRVRRDGSPGYEPTAEQLEGYRREHSPEMVQELKALGVNFVMLHCYKGFGLEAERGSMADAKAFAALCRAGGLRTGCYAFSGTIGWELILEERPDARDWTVRDVLGNPIPYGRALYRHYIDRNHPGAVEYLQRVVRFAAEEMRVDLLHFDNYIVGPGYGAPAAERFRKWLAGRYGPEALAARMGAGGLAAVRPPSPATPDDPLGRDWLRFECEELARSYLDLARYARSLRPEILVECNPGGVGDRTRPPVDHRLLLRGGEAFWDEGAKPGWDGRSLRTRIRTYKAGRGLGNMTFAYATNPLEAAESIAFNLDCLGCIAWFEYGKLAAEPGTSAPVSTALGPYVRLFRRLQPRWGGRPTIADVGVLRPFAAQVFFPVASRFIHRSGEEDLIEAHVPFGIAFDAGAASLAPFRTVLAAGCRVLSDADVEGLLSFARGGRGLVLVEPAGVLGDDLRPRGRSPLEDRIGRPLGSEPFRAEREGSRFAYFPEQPPPADLLDAVRWACGGRFSVEVRGPRHVACEFLRGEGDAVGVHLVNYAAEPARGIEVRLPVKSGVRAARHSAAAGAPEDLPVKLAAPEAGGGPGGLREASIEIPALDVHAFIEVRTADKPLF